MTISRWLLALSVAAAAFAETYEVGPGRPYASIGDAPLAELQPGDTVLIHWRAEPYREKFVLCRQGTADAPITIRGVPGPDGRLPVIDGADAVTPRPLNYWRENRGVIKIGGANIPADTMPRHLVIEYLDIRGAQRGNFFADRFGARQQYAINAAAIDIEKGEDLTIRNCVLSGSGNGLFAGSSEEAFTRNLVVAANYIHSNGVVGSGFEHNVYTEGVNVLFQYNRFGPLRDGAPGNNLKDRSAGLVVRYNWIEGGNRQLDLVETDFDNIATLDDYRVTEVYGNVLIEPDGAGNSQIVHYGGDSGNERLYRKGMLRFEHNTVVSLRRDRTTLFRLSSNGESVIARNNIFYAAATAGNALSLVDNTGRLQLERNWFKPGVRDGFGQVQAVIEGKETSIESATPGFVNEAAQDYRLAEGSLCLDRGGDLPTWPWFQYRLHQEVEPRPAPGAAADLGAFER